MKAIVGGLLVVLSLLNGCSGKAVNENDPAALYAEAQEEISNDHYQMAIEKLKVIKNKFPYSKFSVDAALRLADVYFMQGTYAEAASAYESFRDLHPKHEKTAYAMFRVGKSYFSDIPDPLSRDLMAATRALDAYNEFLKRYPDVPEAAEAKKDVSSIRQTLAMKELYIGNFYYKRDYLDSARPRFQKVVDSFPDTPAAQEAREKLAKLGPAPARKETPAP